MENANENVKQSDEKPKISSIKCFGNRIKDKWAYLRNLITIEPVICLLVIAKVLIVPAITNLHFEKACKVNAGFNDTVCEAIVSGTYLKLNFKEENNVVQSFITKTRSWEIPVSCVVPVILILFVGAYSDRHKIRKPFLLMPLLGDMIGLIGTSISIIFMKQWSLEAQVVADKIIPSIFGSDKLIITMTFAYIADISSKEMRILRLAAIPTMLAFLIPILHAVSGIMFRALGYFPVIGISLSFFIAAFTYGVVKVKESVKIKHDKKELIKDIFNYQHMIDTLKFLGEKKEDFNRTSFILILLICFILAIVQTGEQTTFFLFTQQAYQWTVVDYSYFTTLTAVMKFLGLSVAVPIFAKVFHLSEFIIMIIAYADAIVASSIFLFVRSPLGLYIGRVCWVLMSAGHPANRSLQSKVVSPDDLAKASSLITILGAIAAALSAPIYHQGLYEYTRRTFPQAFLLFGIGMHSLVIIILLWMYFREKRKHQMSEKQVETFMDDNVIQDSEL